MWGTDVIGAIEPRALNGHRFILVDIDYFTKWVEAALYQEDRSVDDRIIQGLARHATLRIAWLSDFFSLSLQHKTKEAQKGCLFLLLFPQ